MQDLDQNISYYLHRNVLVEPFFENYRIQSRKAKSYKEIIFRIPQKVKKRGCSIFLGWILSIFPITSWICQYNWRKDVKHDIICGVTIGVLQIPQSLAYASLASLPPETGLYISLIVPILYMILGTSKYLSLGAYSVISLMVGSVLTSELVTQYATEHSVLNSSGLTTPMSILDAKLIISSSLTFYTGLFQIVGAILGAGIISRLIANSAANGFTFGCLIQTYTTQIPFLLGVTIPSHFLTGYAPVPKAYISIFSALKHANIAEIIIGLLSITFLIGMHYLNLLTQRFIRVPLPSELLLIVIAGSLSYGLNLNQNHGVRILGVIPQGLPGVIIPDFSLFLNLYYSCLLISIVGYAATMSLGMGIKSKKDYLSANQELFSYGFCNLFSSFFYCFVSGASLTRSGIIRHIGGTQLSSVIASIVLAIVVLFGGHLLAPLPLTTLSSIVTITLWNVLKRSASIKSLYKGSKVHASIWFITATLCICANIRIGLMVGALLSISTILYSLIKPNCTLLGEIENSGIYRASTNYTVNPYRNNIIVIQFSMPLVFLNEDLFYQKISKAITDLAQFHENLKLPKHLIIDAKHISYIDYYGCKKYYEVWILAKSYGILLWLADAKQH